MEDPNGKRGTRRGRPFWKKLWESYIIPTLILLVLGYFFKDKLDGIQNSFTEKLSAVETNLGDKIEHSQEVANLQHQRIFDLIGFLHPNKKIPGFAIYDNDVELGSFIFPNSIMAKLDSVAKTLDQKTRPSNIVVLNTLFGVLQEHEIQVVVAKNKLQNKFEAFDLAVKYVLKKWHQLYHKKHGGQCVDCGFEKNDNNVADNMTSN